MKKPYGLNSYEGGYIQLVNLSPGELPRTINVDGEEMVVKPEFHISLVWIGKLSEMVDKQNKEVIKSEMIEEFNKFTDEYSLADYELTKELRLVKIGDNKTIIVMAKVPNIDIFFRKLSERYGAELSVQPTHITLYTLPTDRIGIGILSYDELREWSKPIDIPELQILL